MANRSVGTSGLVAWAMKFDAVYVTIEYRRAPESPDPIPAEDCYAGLEMKCQQGVRSVSYA